MASRNLASIASCILREASSSSCEPRGAPTSGIVANVTGSSVRFPPIFEELILSVPAGLSSESSVPSAREVAPRGWVVPAIRAVPSEKALTRTRFGT